jgi:hypothetical protein
MKYLCLIYVDEKKLEQAPAELVGGEECVAHTEKLRERGQLIAAERLESVQAATTVRSRNGNPTVTDGPFAETKEQLAGFYLVEARDLNEAIRIASEIPPGRFGCIEVRPVAGSPQAHAGTIAMKSTGRS